MSESFAEKYSMLPHFAEHKERPFPYTRTNIIPNILLRNDGWGAEAVDTLDYFYARFASFLQQLAGLHASAILLQEQRLTDSQTRLNILLFFPVNWSILGLAQFLLKGTLPDPKWNDSKEPIAKNPQSWMHQEAIDPNTKLLFSAVTASALDFIPEAKPHWENTWNLRSPSMLIAYGEPYLVDYSYDRFRTPPNPAALKSISDKKTREALIKVSQQVTPKVAAIVREGLELLPND